MNSRIHDMALTAELVALCHRVVPEPPWGTDKYDYFTEQDYTNAAECLLARRPPGPLWIFAYGSLMWKPAFEHGRSVRVVAEGWHRGFSLEMQNYRATPELPGYMMCLDRGGRCEGLAIQVQEKTVAEELRKLLVREVGGNEQLEAARWIPVQSSEGVIDALTFYAAPTALDYYHPGRPPDVIAEALARACGHFGSGAEYLRNTVVHLEQLGIHDEALWKLQRLVAERINAMYR